MNITIERTVLLDRLAQVAKATDSKNAVSILEGIYFESNATLSMTGSDGTLTISTSTDDYLEHTAGVALIPAKKLLEVVKRMPNAPIGIATDEKQGTITCGKTKVNLPVIDPEAYPVQTDAAKEANITMDGKDFCAMVDSIIFAAATDEKTPLLMGVLMQIGDGNIKALTCDRHRLAQYVGDINATAMERNYIVPVKVLDEVTKSRPKEVSIWLGNKIHIAAGEFHYTSRLIEGAYPDTSKLIPDKSDITVTINTAQLLKTLELADKVSEDKTKIVRFDVTATELRITVKDGTSSMSDSLEAESTGEITLSANAKYLIDALKAIEAERVQLQLTGAMKPMILRGEGDDNSLHLVLPYRTTGA